MKKFTTITILTAILAGSAAGASIFSLDAEIYENNTVNLNSFDIADGEITDQTPGRYKVRTVDSEGDTLSSRNFSIQYTVLYNININETSANTTNQTGQPADSRRKLLRLPYSYSAQSVQILKSGEEIYSLDIPEQVCVPDDECPDYCKSKGIDQDCETEETQNNGFISQLINWFSTIVPI